MRVLQNQPHSITGRHRLSKVYWFSPGKTSSSCTSLKAYISVFRSGVNCLVKLVILTKILETKVLVLYVTSLTSIACNPCLTNAFDRYLVTYSPSAENIDPKKMVIIWDIRTGLEKRSFSIDGTTVWPIFRWSKDDKYFARIGQDVLSVYETPVSVCGLYSRLSGNKGLWRMLVFGCKTFVYSNCAPIWTNWDWTVFGLSTCSY